MDLKVLFVIFTLFTPLITNNSNTLCICVAVREVVLVVKNSPTSAGDVRDTGSILDQEDPLEEEMATHSSILAWRIPQTEEPGGLQSIGSQRIAHD